MAQQPRSTPSNSAPVHVIVVDVAGDCVYGPAALAPPPTVRRLQELVERGCGRMIATRFLMNGQELSLDSVLEGGSETEPLEITVVKSESVIAALGDLRDVLRDAGSLLPSPAGDSECVYLSQSQSISLSGAGFGHDITKHDFLLLEDGRFFTRGHKDYYYILRDGRERSSEKFEIAQGSVRVAKGLQLEVTWVAWAECARRGEVMDPRQGEAEEVYRWEAFSLEHRHPSSMLRNCTGNILDFPEFVETMLAQQREQGRINIASSIGPSTDGGVQTDGLTAAVLGDLGMDPESIVYWKAYAR
eukprot:TRINITY_DN16712_c0_g1_i5.p1 TRINITY_DN16712_c0_g1~~TRINITY_DN16712_c0_g1_i5.p1  ORF type:complete len:326 (+),score=28.70 TRINITY_DN16712_c0_g1_i5:75-980(+)